MLKLRHRHEDHAPEGEHAVGGRYPGDEARRGDPHRGNELHLVDPDRDPDRAAFDAPPRDPAHERAGSAGPLVTESPTGDVTAREPTTVVAPTAAGAPAASPPPAATGAEPARRLATHTVISWGIGQLLALAVGIALVIIGSMALSRSGLDVNDLYAPHVQVGGLHHTPLLGLVEVVFGLITIGAAAIPGTVRSVLVLLGLVALAAGIGVLVYTGSGLHDRFGAHDANGWVYVASGAVLLLAVMLPTSWERRVKVRRRP